MGRFLAHEKYDYAGVLPAKTTYPQDIRNCTSCHDGSSTSRARPRPRTATTGRTKPSALACGACHDGINFATGTGVTLHDKAAGLTQSNVNGTGLAHAGGPAARRLALRALPQLERHRPRPPPGDAAEPEQRAGRRRRQREHELGLDRLGRLGRAAAGRRDHADLRRAERLAQREQAAGDGVPLAAERRAACRSIRSPPPPSTRRPDRRRCGTTSSARRARTSCSRCRRTASPRRPTSTPRSSATCARSGTAPRRGSAPAR